MNKGIGSMVKRIMLAAGLMLVLGSQACEDNKLADQAPGKALKSVAPTPAAERREASAASESATDGSSREGAPAGGSK